MLATFVNKNSLPMCIKYNNEQNLINRYSEPNNSSPTTILLKKLSSTQSHVFFFLVEILNHMLTASKV